MGPLSLLLPELRREADVCAAEWPLHIRAAADAYLGDNAPDHVEMADLVSRYFFRVMHDHLDHPELYARDPFYNLPLNEALAKSVAMDIQSRAIKGVRGSAFFLTHKLRARADHMIRQIVRDRLSGRLVQEEFEKRLAAITGLTQNHLRTILYTQATAVLNAGRFVKARTDRKHVNQWPFFRYRNRHLPRSRDTHERMDNFMAAADHPVWERILPPNGYGCLCYVARVNRLEAIRLGVMDEDGTILQSVVYQNRDQQLMVEQGHDTTGRPFPDKGFWHNMGIGFGLL